jgi:beta-phosphoglucomutase
MNNKAIIFDCDGVLTDTNYIHCNSFVKSWNEVNPFNIISKKFHDININGLTTINKIKYLECHFNIHTNKDIILKRKKIYTHEEYINYKSIINMRSIILKLKEDGFKICCASNNDKDILELVLKNIGIIDLLDIYISKESVKEPKPSPDIYLTVISQLNIPQHNIYIFEDNDIGLEAAKLSGANVIWVQDQHILSYNFIKKSIINNKFYHAARMES